MEREIAAAWDRVREVQPLVHHITNYVTVNDVANITLAAGASPIMADCEEEIAEITALSSGLCLNIGTLNERTLSSMKLAAKEAAAYSESTICASAFGSFECKSLVSFMVSMMGLVAVRKTDQVVNLVSFSFSITSVTRRR